MAEPPVEERPEEDKPQSKPETVNETIDLHNNHLFRKACLLIPKQKKQPNRCNLKLKRYGSTSSLTLPREEKLENLFPGIFNAISRCVLWFFSRVSTRAYDIT